MVKKAKKKAKVVDEDVVEDGDDFDEEENGDDGEETPPAEAPPEPVKEEPPAETPPAQAPPAEEPQPSAELALARELWINPQDSPLEARARFEQIIARLKELGAPNVRAMMGHGLPTNWDPIVRHWLQHQEG